MHQHLVDFPLTNMHKNTLEKHCRFRNEEAATHLFKIASWLFVEHSCEKKKPSQVKRNLRNQTYLKKYNTDIQFVKKSFCSQWFFHRSSHCQSSSLLLLFMSPVFSVVFLEVVFTSNQRPLLQLYECNVKQHTHNDGICESKQGFKKRQRR